MNLNNFIILTFIVEQQVQQWCIWTTLLAVISYRLEEAEFSSFGDLVGDRPTSRLGDILRDLYLAQKIP